MVSLQQRRQSHLRYSHWATPKLFGPLPAAFASYLLPSSNAQSKYLLYTTPKPTKASDSGFQREGRSNYNNSNNKRSASVSWGANASKKEKVVASSQLVPPVEALDLAKSRSARFRNTQKQKGSKGPWKGKNKRGK